MKDIEDMFERPKETRITIVIRTPWLVNGGVLISNDDFDQTIAEIARLRERETVKP